MFFFFLNFCLLENYTLNSPHKLKKRNKFQEKKLENSSYQTGVDTPYWVNTVFRTNLVKMQRMQTLFLCTKRSVQLWDLRVLRSLGTICL